MRYLIASALNNLSHTGDASDHAVRKKPQKSKTQKRARKRLIAQIENEIQLLDYESTNDHERRHVLLQRLHSELGDEWCHASQCYV